MLSYCRGAASAVQSQHFQFDETGIVGTERYGAFVGCASCLILAHLPVGITFDFREFEWIIGGTTSQFWSPMAICIIFGLAFATVLTLVVVPVLYSMVASFEALLGLDGGYEPA